MNLRLLRLRRSPNKKKKNASSSGGPRRRRFGVSDMTGERDRQTEMLFMAVCAGDTVEILRIVSNRDCDLTSEMLNCACATGNALSVTILLEHGAPFNSTGGKGDAPIHTAVRRGSVDIIRLLLGYKADINCLTKYERRTSLHLAAALKKLEVLRFLLGQKADVNRADIYGSTPLHLASEGGFSNGVDALLEFDAQPDLFNKDGWTSIHIASANGYMSIVEQLIKANANIDCQNQFGRTPLHWACSRNHEAIVRLLMGNGASVEIQDKHGKKAIDHTTSDDIKALVDVSSDEVSMSVFPYISSCMHYTTGTVELRETRISAVTLALRKHRQTIRGSIDSGSTSCDTERLSSDPDESSPFTPPVFPSFKSMFPDVLTMESIDGTCALPVEWSLSGDVDEDSVIDVNMSGLLRERKRLERRTGQTSLPSEMESSRGFSLVSGSEHSPSSFDGSFSLSSVKTQVRQESHSTNLESKLTRNPRDSTTSVFKHRNSSVFEGELSRRTSSRNSDSETTCTSTNKSVRQLTEESTSSSECSKSEHSNSYETRQQELDQEFPHMASSHRGSRASKSEADDGDSNNNVNKNDDDVDDDDDDNDDGERLSRNVRSVLDRIGSSSEAESPLDEFAKRFMHSSSVYMDAISSSFKLLLHLETPQKQN